MNENEKQEAFDKWYDENYDEWAEGEEGIALREELEQAFKGGVEVLEAENAELKSDNDARKFAMAMSEQVEKQLREENAKLKETVIKMNNVITKTFSNLTKAKDHIKKLLDCLKQDTNDPQTNYYVCQYMDKAEQFLNSEVEK